MKQISNSALYTFTKNLNLFGKPCELYRYTKNELGELTDEKIQVTSFYGLFHSAQSMQRKLKTSEEAVTTTKRIPQLMCLKKDVEAAQLQDEILSEGITYRVTGWTIVGDSDIVDITLEEIQYEH